MDELRKRNYMKTYEAAAEVWHSETATVKEQTDAWRTQRALLLACAGNDPVKQLTVLKKHYEKLEERMGVSQAEYLSQVQSLCATSSSTCENGVGGMATKRKLNDENSELIQPKKGKDVTNTNDQPDKRNNYVSATVTSKAVENVDRDAVDDNDKQNKMNEPFNNFFTARQVLDAKNLKNTSNALASRSSIKPSQQVTPMERQPIAAVRLGMTRNSPNTRRDVRAGFVSPVQKEKNDANIKLTSSPPEKPLSSDMETANIDPTMVELITNQIMRKDTQIDWEDIAGLDNAKTFIREAAVLPLLRPDIFTGIRKPPRGILLFGPPGTGKTLIGKCIASQSGSTFFSISASTLTSKWVGEGEKMVRALFAVAALHKPSVIFIDEIDSLLSKRNETEHESSRRLKTEFLVQFDGTNTTHEDRTLVVGATNRPQELDDAARRRFVRRLYIPLPEHAARLQIVQKLLASTSHNISPVQMDEIVQLTAGYSGADIDSLCHEAAMQPIRSIPLSQMLTLPADEVRPINIDDFRVACRSVRSSVAQDDLNQYLDWNRQYGSL